MTRVLAVLAMTLLPAGAVGSQAQAARNGVVAGQVVDAASGAGLAESIVTLSPAGPVSSPGAALGAATRVITDSRGRFVFANLPRGPYRLGVIKPGYRGGGMGQTTPRSVSQVLDLGDGERLLDVKLLAWKHASITGRVVDEAGEAVVGAEVRVWRSLEGGRRLQPVLNGATTTDDRGIYRVGDLDPGASYVVSVPSISTSLPSSLLEDYFRAGDGAAAGMQLAMAAAAPTAKRPGSAANQVIGEHVLQVQGRMIVPSSVHADGSMAIYRSLFYPQAATSAQAEILTLRAGEQRTGIDFALRPVRAVVVSGSLESASGPIGIAPIQLITMEGLAGGRTDDAIAATTVSDETGRFTLLAVPPGRYELRAWKEPVEPQQPTWWIRMPLTIGEKPVADLRVTMGRGFRVTGRMATDPGDLPLPRRVAVHLDPSSGYLFPTETFAGADGTFVLPELPGGSHRFTVPLPAGWHVKSILHEGRDLADAAFELSADIRDVIVTISMRGARLSGSVKNEANTVAGARVIIFSADPRQWVQVGPYDRRLKEATTGRDGRYVLGDLPAGEYLIVAGTAEIVNWDRPNLLESLSKLASRVRLAEGEARSLDLRVVGSK
jgi:hypothetical protein